MLNSIENKFKVEKIRHAAFTIYIYIYSLGCWINPKEKEKRNMSKMLSPTNGRQNGMNMRCEIELLHSN